MRIKLSDLRRMIREVVTGTMVEGVTADLNDRRLDSMSRAEMMSKIKEIDSALRSAEGHSRDVLLHWKNRLNKRMSFAR